MVVLSEKKNWEYKENDGKNLYTILVYLKRKLVIGRPWDILGFRCGDEDGGKKEHTVLE
jgi:hypothetical protein